jgi:transcription elongation factor Elf1
MSDALFVCPYCNREIEIPDNAWYITCAQCGNRLNLESQFAYLRGLDAFSEGQEIMNLISPRKRRIASNARDRQAINLFMEAYTALQVAFKAEMAEAQRALGVEMMAAMAGEFMKRNMVSALEWGYWSSILVEQNSQVEFDELKGKIQHARGVLGSLMRLRWRLRQKQLAKALVDLDRKLKALETQIQFVDLPRARNKKWNP